MDHQEGAGGLTGGGRALKTSIWLVIVVVIGVVSFLIGYSHPHSIKQQGAPMTTQGR